MTSHKEPEYPADPLPHLSPWRDRLHEIIFEAETPAGTAFDVALIVAIIASVAVVVLSTLPSAAEEPARTVFLTLEWGFTIFFTIEYLLRLIIVRRPWRYAFSFFGIIDLLAILPAFIGLVVPGGERLLVVRTMRLLRIFRVFKLARYLSEATALRRALIVSRHKIAVFITTILIIVLIASALMHIVEGNAGNTQFDSMPSAMYWAIITMTTVGYGDITPITAIGKATTSILVLLGYSMIIVPTGILSAGMSDFARQTITTRTCASCMTEGLSRDAVYCKRCGEQLEVPPDPEQPQTPPQPHNPRTPPTSK